MDDTIKLEDFDIDNMLIDEKSHENILIYNISYKPFTGPKPLRIIFDKIDRFIRIDDGNRYLVLVALQKYDPIYMSYKSKNQYHIYFLSLFYKNQS